MVTNTFLNLKKEKKDRIIEAAKKEFSRVPLDKALVSNIIRDSKIPRGSFYQYFENIDDLFIYIIDEMRKKVLESYQDVVTGDEYFDVLKKNFYKALTIFENGENKQFNLNIYMSFINLEMKGSSFLNDLNKLRISEEDSYVPKEVRDLPNSRIFLGLIEMANITCLNEFVLGKKNKKEVFEEYSSYLDYIQKAIIKTNKL